MSFVKNEKAKIIPNLKIKVSFRIKLIILEVKIELSQDKSH